MSNKDASDIRGAGNLTIDAITGITNLVESMHHTIASFGRILAEPNQNQATGITGMVCRNIRAVSGLEIDYSMCALAVRRARSLSFVNSRHFIFDE